MKCYLFGSSISIISSVIRHQKSGTLLGHFRIMRTGDEFVTTFIKRKGAVVNRLVDSTRKTLRCNIVSSAIHCSRHDVNNFNLNWVFGNFAPCKCKHLTLHRTVELKSELN